MEDEAAKAYEWNHEKEFERIDDVVAYLRGRHIKAEEKGYCETEERGAAKNGIDADEEADGDAPGELFRSCSHTQESEDGKGDAAVDPVVLNGRGSWFDTCENGFVWIHC